MQGYLFKKSRSWTQYLRLWGPTWKKQYLILTNIGLLVFEDN